MTRRPAVLATRGSTLALWQANFIADLLKAEGLNTELSVIKTTGDIVQDRFLHEIGGKGLFIKELEEAMRRGEADLAMHSLKDLPVRLPDGFQLTAILKRHSVCDAIIFRKSLYDRLGLSPGETLNSSHVKSLGPLRIATSSLRRQALLEQLGSGIIVKPIRGNVDTRLKKLESEDWHALILAEASLERLNIKGLCAHRLDPQWFIPCAGQGAIAVETPSDSPYLADISKINCTATNLHVSIERAVLKALGGDCTMPFGCLVQKDARAEGSTLARVIVLDLEGRSACAMHSLSDHKLGDGSGLVSILLEKLKADGVNKILETLKITQRV